MRDHPVLGFKEVAGMGKNLPLGRVVGCLNAEHGFGDRWIMLLKVLYKLGLGQTRANHQNFTHAHKAGCDLMKKGLNFIGLWMLEMFGLMLRRIKLNYFSVVMVEPDNGVSVGDRGHDYFSG
jgi:hypothetical protein